MTLRIENTRARQFCWKRAKPGVLRPEYDYSVMLGWFKREDADVPRDPQNVERVTIDLLVPEAKLVVQDASINFLLGAGTSIGHFSGLGDIEEQIAALDAADLNEVAEIRVRAALYSRYFEAAVLPNTTLRASSTGSTLLERYAKFLGTLNSVLIARKSAILNRQSSIFTTNIDIAIEMAGEALGVELNDGFVGRLDPILDMANLGDVRMRRSLQYDNLSEIPTINLLKLHGSVHWEAHAEHGFRGAELMMDRDLSSVTRTASALKEVRDSLVEPPADWSDGSLSRLLDSNPIDSAQVEAIAEFVRLFETLQLVNPTAKKFEQTVLNRRYYELLRFFANSLEKENSALFVVGFSFRDAHIRNLVLSAANKNPTLLVLVFAFDNEAAEALATLLPKDLIPNRNVRVIPPLTDEHEWTLEALADDVLNALLSPRDRKASSDWLGEADPRESNDAV